MGDKGVVVGGGGVYWGASFLGAVEGGLADFWMVRGDRDFRIVRGDRDSQGFPSPHPPMGKALPTTIDYS